MEKKRKEKRDDPSPNYIYPIQASNQASTKLQVWLHDSLDPDPTELSLVVYFSSFYTGFYTRMATI